MAGCALLHSSHTSPSVSARALRVADSRGPRVAAPSGAAHTRPSTGPGSSSLCPTAVTRALPPGGRAQWCCALPWLSKGRTPLHRWPALHMQTRVSVAVVSRLSRQHSGEYPIAKH
eukprot:706626-Pleurochrysis_carterae.AAC.1